MIFSEMWSWKYGYNHVFVSGDNRLGLPSYIMPIIKGYLLDWAAPMGEVTGRRRELTTSCRLLN